MKPRISLIAVLFISHGLHAQDIAPPNPDADVVARAYERLAKQQGEAATRPTRPIDQSASNATIAPAEPSSPTFENLFSALPASAHPTPADGWDEFSRPKAQKWSDENLVGAAIQEHLKVANVHLMRVYPDPAHFNDTLRWDISLTCYPQKANLVGLDTAIWFGEPNSKLTQVSQQDQGPAVFMAGGHHLEISGDEDLAKRFKSLQPNDEIVVKGSIASIQIGPLDPIQRAGLASSGAVNPQQHFANNSQAMGSIVVDLSGYLVGIGNELPSAPSLDAVLNPAPDAAAHGSDKNDSNQAGKSPTFESLVAAMPTDAQPDPTDGWDQFSLPKARKWVDDNLKGQAIRQSAIVDRVRIVRISKEGDENQTLRWEVYLICSPQKETVCGLRSAVWLQSPPEDFSDEEKRAQASAAILFQPTNTIVMAGDESLARRAKGWHKGEAIYVQGTVASIGTEAMDGFTSDQIFGADFDPTTHTPTSARHNSGSISLNLSGCEVTEDKK